MNRFPIPVLQRHAELRSVPRQLFLAQHAVVIFVQVEVLAVDAERGRGRKPVGFLHFFRQLFVPELEQVVEEAARQNVQDLYLARPQWVEEKEKLAHARADVKGIERSLESVELRQGRNELEYVILQIRFAQVALTGDVIKAQADTRLVQPDLPHYVIEKL